MKAERSHHLLSANWRPKRAGGVIQSESEGLRMGRADVQGQDKMDVAAQSNRENKFSLSLSFCLFTPSVEWTMPPSSILEGDLLYFVH